MPIEPTGSVAPDPKTLPAADLSLPAPIGGDADAPPRFSRDDVHRAVAGLAGRLERRQGGDLLNALDSVFSPGEMLQERLILMQLRLLAPGLDDATLGLLDNALDRKRSGLLPLRNIRAIALDGFNWHGAQVRGVLVAGGVDPGGILSVRLPERPRDRAKEPSGLAFMYDNITAALEKLAALVGRIRQSGAAPPVINISMVTGQYVGQDGVVRAPYEVDAASLGPGLRAPTFASLGYPPNADLKAVIGDPAGFRRRCLASGNPELQAAVRLADALLRLADTGAKVFLALGNKAAVPSVQTSYILAHRHPGVTFVGAQDPEGQPNTRFNLGAPGYAEAFGYGQIVRVPPNLPPLAPLEVAGRTPVDEPYSDARSVQPGDWVTANELQELIRLKAAGATPPPGFSLAGRVLTRPQMEALVGRERVAGHTPFDADGDDPRTFVIDDPESFMRSMRLPGAEADLEGVSNYLPVTLRDGSTWLVETSDGTSFASPAVAAQQAPR